MATQVATQVAARVGALTFGQIAKATGKKVLESTVAVGVGYEVGKALNEEPIVVKPNITITLPNTDKAEKYSLNDIVIIIVAIVSIFLLLIALKAYVSKYLRRVFVENRDVNYYQASYTAQRVPYVTHQQKVNLPQAPVIVQNA